MKKNDWIIILGGLLIALAIYGGLQLNNSRFADADKQLEVYIEGEVVESISLEVDGSYRYETELGYNVITVQDGEAFVSEADCDTQSCVNEGHIYSVNQSVVCLPHHFHITISGTDIEEAEVDAISQ